MRIGLLTQWYDPEPGPAALPAALARGLVERGHEVTVLTGFPNYPTGRLATGYRIRPRLEERLDGVRVVRVALYPSHEDSTRSRVLNYGSFGLSAAALGVRRAFAGIDALWVNFSPVTVAAPMLTQGLLRRTPTVVHILDLWPDTLVATGFAGKGRLATYGLSGIGKLCDATYAAASTVAYISPGVGTRLLERGVPESKLAYAPMWADESLFRVTSPLDVRNFGVKETDRVLLYAGTMGRAQNLEPLLRAAAQLRDSNLVCLFAGSGTEEARLRELAVDIGATNVRFLGRLPSEQMPELMATADVHFASLNDDPLATITMPSKVQAILASGGVVIGSLSGDAADVVRESGAGWTCVPGDVDGLTRVLAEFLAEDPGALDARRVAARSYYDSHFARARGVDRIEGLLTDAVEGGP